MRCSSRLVFWILALLMAVENSSAGARNTGSKDEKSNALPAQQAEYVVGADDILVVNVWKEAEISRSVLVRPDGKISLPLIGDLPATGRTPSQLRDDITEKLRTYLSDPEVTVIVQETRSRKFNILGEVEHPGSYPLTQAMTVLDAIAVAGGFRDFARTTRIFVLRANADGSRARIAFNYKEAIKGNKPGQISQLQPNDTIVVP
jgi:polysaccharide biosynthesis/export protein